jgi:hypothetical protein
MNIGYITINKIGRIMEIIFEFNNKEIISIDKDKIKLKRNSFPIKVKLFNNKGKESERIIFIREKRGVPKMLIS